MDPEKDPEQRLDRWLDDALARYSGAEPREGLETRVLASLREAEEKPRRRGWMTWTAALVTAAAAIVVIAVVHLNREASPLRIAPSRIVSEGAPSQQPEGLGGEGRSGAATAGGRDEVAGKSALREPEPAAQAPVPETPTAGASAPAREPAFAAGGRAAAPRIRPAPAIAPRAAVFPLPSPLSEQEKLAIAAIRSGLPPSAKPGIPPVGELLPQVEIREIKIVALKDSEPT
jgi:hypothetical protein